MTKRKLTSALVGKLRIAVPCSASDPKSIQAAMDAIKALTDKLPPGSSVEFIGEPQFGKVERVVQIESEMVTLVADPVAGTDINVYDHTERVTTVNGEVDRTPDRNVVTLAEPGIYRTEITAEQASVLGSISVDPVIPSHLDRRVPRH